MLILVSECAFETQSKTTSGDDEVPGVNRFDVAMRMETLIWKTEKAYCRTAHPARCDGSWISGAIRGQSF